MIATKGLRIDLALPERTIASWAMDEFDRHPVVHTWSYKLDQAA